MGRQDVLQSLLVIGRVFWSAFLISALLAYPIWRLLIRLKSRQNVSQHLESHQVKQGTPTMGGLIIAVGTLAVYAGIAIGAFGDAGGSHGPIGMSCLIVFTGFMVIGFLDDFVVPRYTSLKRGLGWRHKILMQLAVAVVAALVLSAWKFDGWTAVFVFLILFYSNAFNFADGLDGLAGTLLLGLAAGVCALGWHSGWGTPWAVVTAPLFASAIPFLYLNAPPAKVFMGDVGSLPIGAILGLATTALARGQAQEAGGGAWMMAIPLLILSLILLIELVPVPLQILSVKIRKRRLFPFKTPIHHGLEDAGWPETRITAAFALTQVLLSILALGVYIQLVANGAPTDVLAR